MFTALRCWRTNHNAGGTLHPGVAQGAGSPLPALLHQDLPRGDGPHHGGLGPWAPRPQRDQPRGRSPCHTRRPQRGLAAPPGFSVLAARPGTAHSSKGRVPLSPAHIWASCGVPRGGWLHRASGTDVPPAATQRASRGTGAVPGTWLVSRLPAPGQRPPTQVLNPAVSLEGQNWPGDQRAGIRPEPEVMTSLPGEVVTQRTPGQPPSEPGSWPVTGDAGPPARPSSRQGGCPTSPSGSQAVRGRAPRGPPGPPFSGLLLGRSRGRRGVPVT